MARERASNDDTSERSRNVLACSPPQSEDLFDSITTNSSQLFYDMTLFNFGEPGLERPHLEQLDNDQYGSPTNLAPHEPLTSTSYAGSETHNP